MHKKEHVLGEGLSVLERVMETCHLGRGCLKRDLKLISQNL